MMMRRQALRPCAPLATSFFLSLILVLLSTLPSFLAQAEPAASGASAAATQAQAVSPGDMNTGALLLQSGEDGAFVEAPRLNTDVVMTVNGTIARVAVTQESEERIRVLCLVVRPDGGIVAAAAGPVHQAPLRGENAFRGAHLGQFTAGSSARRAYLRVGRSRQTRS